MASQGESVVLSSIADGVMVLTLNRPERGNGWTGAMSRAYFGLLEQGARNPDVRVILVTGAGTAFCSGGDPDVLGGIAGNGGAGEADRVVPGTLTDHLLALRIGKPVIAAINGACFGIGMQQALACDIRFASEGAKFSTAFARRGLPAEMGISWLLPRLVGTGHAMDLLLSARLVRAPEAERIGLVNRVVPADALLDEARAYALDMAEKCAPSALRTIKAQAWGDLMRGIDPAYDRAGKLMDAGFAGADFREGVASWQEARAPAFPPLSPEAAFIDWDEKA